jgi:hypothetical protein
VPYLGNIQWSAEEYIYHNAKKCQFCGPVAEISVSVEVAVLEAVVLLNILTQYAQSKNSPEKSPPRAEFQQRRSDRDMLALLAMP